MFQAVLAGCILINFFIYDPLLYFLKKLAGAKNLLDLHALGQVSGIRSMQECIKTKRSQCLQSSQAPTRAGPGLLASSWGRLSEPQSCTRSQVPAELAGCYKSIQRCFWEPSERWWPCALWWHRLATCSVLGRWL